MKVSDYIVEYLINKNIKDVFGYPGGMVTHLMDSLYKKKEKINSHLLYHEQAVSYAACAYAQLNQQATIAYATSGPGATNLVTGIANAFFDSIPVVFITGQVNTFESKNGKNVRQSGFQETNIISIVKDITKWCHYVSRADEILYCLEKAFYECESERKGPVLLDIPMDIFRSEIDPSTLKSFHGVYSVPTCKIDSETLLNAKRPVLVLGAGAKYGVDRNRMVEFIEKWDIPVVTSMIAFDLLPYNHKNYFGFIGAYGHRVANFIVAKSDLVICIGSRMDIRQTGFDKQKFASNAKIIRFDIDENELETIEGERVYKYRMSANQAIEELYCLDLTVQAEWNKTCEKIKGLLGDYDEKSYQEKVIDVLSIKIPNEAIITTDVGQNQVWVAQYFKTKSKHRVLFSGGHGAMGYSLPAAIGASINQKDNVVVSFNGDGGFQMNLQELEVIARDKLPVKIVIFNNQSLGMIRHFQEMYFASNYAYTTSNYGYSVPDFIAIGEAYGIHSFKVRTLNELKKIELNTLEPVLIEISLPETTYVFPKLEYGKPNQDQEPKIDRNLYKMIMDL